MKSKQIILLLFLVHPNPTHIVKKNTISSKQSQFIKTIIIIYFGTNSFNLFHLFAARLSRRIRFRVTNSFDILNPKRLLEVFKKIKYRLIEFLIKINTHKMDQDLIYSTIKLLFEFCYKHWFKKRIKHFETANVENYCWYYRIYISVILLDAIFFLYHSIHYYFCFCLSYHNAFTI